MNFQKLQSHPCRCRAVGAVVVSLSSFFIFCVILGQKSDLTPSAAHCLLVPKEKPQEQQNQRAQLGRWKGGSNKASWRISSNWHIRVHIEIMRNPLFDTFYMNLFIPLYPFLSFLYTWKFWFSSWCILRQRTTSSSSTISLTSTEIHWALDPDRAILEKRTGTGTDFNQMDTSQPEYNLKPVSSTPQPLLI